MGARTNPALTAGGDIRQARFIKLSTAADHTALEADANERVVGVSMDAAQDAPIPSAGANAAEAGDEFNWYGEGEECTITAGDTITRADLLKSDADGKAVPAATTGTTLQWIGAEALESAVAGEKVRIIVRNFAYRPALS